MFSTKCPKADGFGHFLRYCKKCIYRDEKLGLVRIDREQCVGCKFCAKAITSAMYSPQACGSAKYAICSMKSKTGAYGANIYECDTRGHIQYHNNSCRDISCSMCQALANELWVDAQNEQVLDIDYYHFVFTCPSELNPLIYCKQKELYSFFQAVADWTQTVTGIRKRMDIFCPGKRWQSFLQENSCPCCGGNVSYKACSKYVTHRKNSD